MAQETPSQRIIQMNQLIRDHVSGLFLRELSLKPGVLITVAKVDTTPDLRYTRVFVSVFPEVEANYAIETLHSERRGLEIALHKLLATKPMPHLSFMLDGTESKADVIERLLIDIKHESNEKLPGRIETTEVRDCWSCHDTPCRT